MNSRSKKKYFSPVKKRVENSWTMLIKESLLNDNDSFEIITLPHPGSGENSKFCLDKANNCIYEVVTYDEPYRSWFIDESVKSDGRILMTTPIHPTFLVLPLLRSECIKRAIPLEDLLAEKYSKILDYINKLDHVADLKGTEDIKAYKYNESKTMDWLEERVHKVAKILRERNIHVTYGAVSSTFVTSSKDSNDIDEEFYLRYAHSIVSDYLQQDLSEALKSKFKLQAELVENIAKKRKSQDVQTNPDMKKIKIESTEELPENNMSLNNSIENKKSNKLTSKAKQLQKAASGTKSISSFFLRK